MQITLDSAKLNPKMAFEIASTYARPIPELEDIIATKSNFALRYAQNVIKGRFHKGEAVIITDSNRAYDYARDIIKGRWPEAEDSIKKKVNLAYYYSVNCLRERWLEAEEIIKHSEAYWPAYCEHFNIN